MLQSKIKIIISNLKKILNGLLQCPEKQMQGGYYRILHPSIHNGKTGYAGIQVFNEQAPWFLPCRMLL